MHRTLTARSVGLNPTGSTILTHHPSGNLLDAQMVVQTVDFLWDFRFGGVSKFFRRDYEQ